jgi:hypothetical protein
VRKMAKGESNIAMYFSTRKKVRYWLYFLRKNVSFNPMLSLQFFDSKIFIFRSYNGSKTITGIKTHNDLKNIFMITSVFIVGTGRRGQFWSIVPMHITMYKIKNEK